MTGYRIDLRIKVNRRWEELETKNQQYELPQTFSEALRALADTTEEAELLKERNSILESRDEAQRMIIDHLTPDAEYTRSTLKSQSVMTTTQLAKEMGMSAITLNKKLKQLRIQYKIGGQWVLYAEYQDKGYTNTHTYTEDVNGDVRTWHSTVWTESGRKFVHELIKGA
jgi:anti-repressor protein